MSSEIKFDNYPYEYLYGFLSDAEVLNNGSKANVYKLDNEVYKVFDATNSDSYIKNQGGKDIFIGKLIGISSLDIPFLANLTKIIYNSDEETKNNILCYISNYIGDKYKLNSMNYEETIKLYQDLANKMHILDENGIVMSDGFNFDNLRLMDDNTFGFVDLDGMQFHEVFKTQSRTDHFDRFLNANRDISFKYYNEYDNTYSKEVNTFNHIALFLFDMLGLNISKYNQDYVDLLIKDIGILNEDINEKIRRIFSRDKNIYFTDSDFEDLIKNYEIKDANGITGNTKKFNLK